MTLHAPGFAEMVRDGSPVRSAHRLHALGMLIIPLIGAVAACVDAAQHGVTTLNLMLLVCFYLANGIGITVGFHRLLAHRSFRAPTWLLCLLSIAGSTAGQGPPIYWAANHRRHHRYSDQAGDPHSPYVVGSTVQGGLRGFIHAHMGWTIAHDLTSTLAYAPDLLKSPAVRFVNRHYLIWLSLSLIIPAAIGALATQSAYGAYSALLWGGFVRLLLAYHFTLAINSITHIFGEREFDTGDFSRNSVWLAVPTLGEAWHNNHHAFPSAAVFSASWWQVDIGGYLILLLQRIGVINDAKTITRDMLARRRRRK